MRATMPTRPAPSISANAPSLCQRAVVRLCLRTGMREPLRFAEKKKKLTSQRRIYTRGIDSRFNQRRAKRNAFSVPLVTPFWILNHLFKDSFSPSSLPKRHCYAFPSSIDSTDAPTVGAIAGVVVNYRHRCRRRRPFAPFGPSGQLLKTKTENNQSQMIQYSYSWPEL